MEPITPEQIAAEVQAALDSSSEFLATLPTTLFSERATLEELRKLFDEIKEIPRDKDCSPMEPELAKLGAIFGLPDLVDSIANCYNRFFLSEKAMMPPPVKEAMFLAYHRTLDVMRLTLENKIIKGWRDGRVENLKEAETNSPKATPQQIQELMKNYHRLQELSNSLVSGKQ